MDDKWGYSRTSTADQDGDGQRHVLMSAGVAADHIVLDRGVSGLKPALERPEFSVLYPKLTPGSVLYVPDLSRIGRDAIDVLSVVRELDKRDIGLVILSVGGAVVNTKTSLGVFFLQIMAAVSELSRSQIADMTRMKLQARKEQGTYPLDHKTRPGEPVVFGKPRILTDAQMMAMLKMREAGVSVKDLAVANKISVATCYEYLRRARNAVTG
jgi:putative DNA-invertase from lambdoid prophage Rac